MCKYTNKLVMFLSVILIIITLNGCTTSPQSQNNDDPLIKIAYSDYKVPTNFYKDIPSKENSTYHSIFYYNGDFYYPDKFVCTNDKSYAQNKIIGYINFRGWGDSHTFTNVSENEKFFQFITLKSLYNNNTYYNVYRVIKCDYLQDIQYFGFTYDEIGSSPGNYIGKFMKKPITKENVNELIEFLWSSYFYNDRMYGSKIITTSIIEDTNSIKKTFIETNMGIADWGGCDQISLHKTTFSVNKITGNITLSSREGIRTVSGKCR